MIDRHGKGDPLRSATPIVLIPITLPSRSTSGPPLLPGLIAASVWISVTLPACLTPLTIPRVTVFCRTPSADPMATTSWPDRTLAADPSEATGCSASGARA